MSSFKDVWADLKFTSIPHIQIQSRLEGEMGNFIVKQLKDGPFK
jgi:hypothetical protein